MSEYKHNPPSVTKTFRSRELMDAWNHFDIERRIQNLVRDDISGQDIVNLLLSTVVSISAYDPMRGNRSPFPPPIEFIDEFLGVQSESSPALPAEISHFGADLLRASYQMKEWLDDHEDILFLHEDVLRCPICDKFTAFVRVGYCPMWLDDEAILAWSNDKCILGLRFGCECRGFIVDDYLNLLRKLRQE